MKTLQELHKEISANKDLQKAYAAAIENDAVLDFVKANAYLLSGRAPYAFSDEEIKIMLSRGVYLDVGAVETLHEMGYGDLVSFAAGKPLSNDVAEVYTEHNLNTGFVGKKRFCSSIFCDGEEKCLIPHENAEVLCYAEDFHGNKMADCTMGLFHNRLGGVVCAAGYYPTSELSDTVKSLQMKRIFRFLSHEKLPAIIESYHRIRLVVRHDEGGTAILLLNTTDDHLTNVRILVENYLHSLVLCDEKCRETALKPVSQEGTMNRYTISELPPHSVVLLREEKI